MVSERTLFLAWQDDLSRQWFPVGRLDADVDQASYRFRYTGGAKRAQQDTGFPLLLEFPEMYREYRSQELFPLFRNRVMNRRRPDFVDYLRSLDLPEDADSIAILSANGGSRETDSYEVFPRIEKDAGGCFRCRFVLHGSRYLKAKERIKHLPDREPLSVTLERDNPATGQAVVIRTTDGHRIGSSPHYLVGDLAVAIAERPVDCRAMIVRVNPQLVPSSHRVLIEVRGRLLADHEPMSGSDFMPLVS